MKIGIIRSGQHWVGTCRTFPKTAAQCSCRKLTKPRNAVAGRSKNRATPVDMSEMAGGIDLLVIAIPMKSMPSLPKDLLADLPTSSPAFSRILETRVIRRLEERRRDTADKLNPTQTI